MFVTIVASLTWYYLFLPPSSDYPGLLSDSVRYLFMAEYFGGQTDFLSYSYFQGSVFPPMLPLAIWLSGNSAEAAHHLSAAAFLLSSIPFYLWIRKETRIEQAILITGVAWLSPSLVAFSLDILSEGLFLFLLLLAFNISRLSSRRETASGLALVTACAILTRSIGIALIPAYLVWFWKRRHELDRSTLIFSALTLVLPVLCWQYYKSARGSEAGAGYLEVWIERSQVSAAGLWGTVSENITAVFDAGRFNGGSLLNLILIGLAAPTVFKRLREQEFDALFVLAYSLIILAWPFPDQMNRFLAVMAPLFVFYAIKTVSSIFRRANFMAVALATAALFTAFLPANLNHIERLTLTVPSELQKYKRSSHWVAIEDESFAKEQLANLHRLALAHAHVNKSVGPDQCVYAVLADLLSYNSRRITMQMPRSVSELTECRYAFASQLTPVQYHLEPMFPVYVEGFVDYDPVWATMDENEIPVAALLELKVNPAQTQLP